VRIAIVADHNGVPLKAQLVSWLTEAGHHVDDRGVHDETTVDYPALCVDVTGQVTGGHADRAIVVGGTGSGEAVACNKVRGIRASLCQDLVTAEIARGNNDANVLILGAKIVAPDLARRLTELWLATPFKGGRHQRRVEQIAAIERGDPLD
jgi:ribose 5-phosphate isomerase B